MQIETSLVYFILSTNQLWYCYQVNYHNRTCFQSYPTEWNYISTSEKSSFKSYILCTFEFTVQYIKSVLQIIHVRDGNEMDIGYVSLLVTPAFLVTLPTRFRFNFHSYILKYLFIMYNARVYYVYWNYVFYHLQR